MAKGSDKLPTNHIARVTAEGRRKQAYAAVQAREDSGNGDKYSGLGVGLITCSQGNEEEGIKDDLDLGVEQLVM